jgi:hypothetical protein
MAAHRCCQENRTMSFPLDDLSPAALETLADLIEERLENPEAGYAAVTWHEAQARRNAERELHAALEDAEMLPRAVYPVAPAARALTLH